MSKVCGLDVHREMIAATMLFEGGKEYREFNSNIDGLEGTEKELRLRNDGKIMPLEDMITILNKAEYIVREPVVLHRSSNAQWAMYGCCRSTLLSLF